MIGDSGKIFWIVGHSCSFEHFDQFLLERFESVMFLLIGDVMAHGLAGSRANREGGITFLPGEGRQTDLLMHP